MPPRQTPLPRIWLISDQRNDARLERVLERLPRGSGLIFRHYHLPPDERRARFETLKRIARRRGHRIVLSGNARQARAWGADGIYGAAPARAGPMLRLFTVHSRQKLAAAQRKNADAVLISPVFATRSHPGGSTLGPLRWRQLARQATTQAIALGGMTARRARAIGAGAWAAIDGL